MLKMTNLTPREKYQICKTNDKSYDGIFFMGVHSTNIYCLPSCKAKIPLFKNVSFYEKSEMATEDGLRGCKRCRSEFYPLTQPRWLDSLLNHMKNNLNEKLTENDFEKLSNTNISTIRRYFKEYLNTTPSAYHRKLRLKKAKELLREIPLMDVPYITGFSSLSGFRSAYFKEFGKNPGEDL